MFPYYSFHPRALPTVHRPWRPKAEELKPNCPRCDSSNTKFCYYNNYCLTQPRYLCKRCRRYWTKGGSLRNVPVGGGRKSRRGKSAKLNSTVSSSLLSPPNSLRPDHALETMSGRTSERFVLPDQSVDFAQLFEKEEEFVPAVGMPTFDEESFGAEIGDEAALSNNYVEERILGEKKDFLSEELMEVKRREFGGMMMDSGDNYFIGENDYASETDLLWESSRFQGIGISVMAQQNDVGLASLEAFL